MNSISARIKSSYDISDVKHSLSEAGLVAGDTVFVTTSLGMLGNAKGVQEPVQLNSLFFNALRDVVGAGGTIIVPTYSYTFAKSTASKPAIFDPFETPAETGPFPNYFRQQPGVLRSLDPMTSVAGLGPRARSLFKDLPPASYGSDCIFERLTKLPNTKCCNIGLGPNWMPFIHYADWLSGAPFRYDKLFTGRLKLDGRVSDAAWLYSVRLLHPASFATGHEIGRRATKKGIWNYASLGRGRVYVACYRSYFEYTMSLLKKDPWLSAVGPPLCPHVLNREKA